MQVFIDNNVGFCVKLKKKYYPQTLLEECKYEPKKIKMENLIDDDLEKSSSDGSDNDSNNKSLTVYVTHALLGLYLCYSA